MLSPFKHLPKQLRWPIEGLIQMIAGSEEEKLIQDLAEQLAAEYVAGTLPRLPHVYLICVDHDGLVPASSSLHFAPSWPEHYLHRCVVSARELPLQEGVTRIPARAWFDNHVGVMLDPGLHAFMRQCLQEAAAELAA